MLLESRKSTGCVALCALASSVTPVAAGEEPTTLDRITVTDSAIEDRFDPGTTDPTSRARIDQAQVERQQAKNLIEILGSVSGVTADLQGDGETIKIKLRGIENQRFMGEKPGVAIVVDGVPVFERTGKVNIDLDNIERIEVVKGAASYLYGDDALAGAVMITTRRGAGQRGLRVDADRGAFGYRRHLLHAGFAGDALSGHVQYGEREQDGYYYLSSTHARTWSGHLQYALDDASDLSLGFEKSERFRDREGSVTGVTAATLDPTGRNEGRGYTRNFDVDLSRWNLRYSRDLDERSQLMAVVYEYRDDTSFWSAPMRFDAAGRPTTDVDDYSALNDYRQTQRGAKAEYRVSLPRFALMGGLDLRRNAFDNDNRALNSFRTTPRGPVTAAGTQLADDETRERMRALYGEAKFALGNATVATMNVRRDRVDVDFDAAPVAGNGNRAVSAGRAFEVDSYRAGVTHALGPSSSLFAAASTGFRLPTAEQLYRGETTTNAWVHSNPDLRPEQAISLEIGARHRRSIVGWDTSFAASVFQIDRDDFILDSNGQYASTGTTIGGGSQFRNIGGARSRGLELEARTTAHAGWAFEAALSFLDARFTRYDDFFLSLGNANGRFVADPTPAQRADPSFWRSNYTVVAHDNGGKRIPRAAPRTLDLRAHWFPAPGWAVTGELDARARSWADEINQERWPGFTLFHASARYERKLPGPSGTRLTLFARVENVFDKRHWLIARGTGDANYDGRYDREDLSIVPDPGRTWRVGLSLRY
ncbi:MAG: TonB-dependent receptor [Burkholderiaceae bacterium]|nr:TonB-dependent receptor [Burkholderiaceae bacterium]